MIKVSGMEHIVKCCLEHDISDNIVLYDANSKTVFLAGQDTYISALPEYIKFVDFGATASDVSIKKRISQIEGCEVDLVK